MDVIYYDVGVGWNILFGQIDDNRRGGDSRWRRCFISKPMDLCSVLVLSFNSGGTDFSVPDYCRAIRDSTLFGSFSCIEALLPKLFPIFWCVSDNNVIFVGSFVFHLSRFALCALASMASQNKRCWTNKQPYQ